MSDTVTITKKEYDRLLREEQSNKWFVDRANWLAMHEGNPSILYPDDCLISMQHGEPCTCGQHREVEGLRASAMDALARGFAILTLEPHDKSPWARYSAHACNSATRDPQFALRAWTDGQPANYGVATGPSDITVLDCDFGLNSFEEFEAWRIKHGIPETFTVVSGREKFGCHMYFSGAIKTQPFSLGGVRGELKGHGGYVVGAGSIHPSGRKYQIYRDAPLALLPKVFEAKPVLKGLDITDPAVQKCVRDQYWKGSIEDNAIVWYHPNIITFFEEHGLTLAKVLPFVGKCEFKGHCGTCQKKGLNFSATSRTAFAEIVRNVLVQNNGICDECSEKSKTAKAEADKIAAEQAAIARQQALAEKEQELATYKVSLELKHGACMTGLLCPECEDGYLIVRLNSTQMKPFASCSRFNPHKYSCKYATSVAPEHHEEYLKLFGQRLTASVGQ